LKESIKLNTTKIERVTESLTSNQIELDVAMKETIHEQKELESNRDILYKDIEPNYLNTYEKLRSSRDVGMASIIGAACGGCYSQLPPQTIIEIKENKHIINCPNCSLFQYWNGVEEF
jgi:hypothetical protein